MPNIQILSARREQPSEPSKQVTPDALDWDASQSRSEFADSLLSKLCHWTDLCNPVDRAEFDEYENFFTLLFSWISSLGQWAGAIVAIFGLLITLGGFFFVWLQIRDQKRSLETQTSWTMYETSLVVLNTFVANPELRPFFYGNSPLPESGDKREKVLAAAEIISDHLENIVSSGESGAIDEETYYVWVKYIWLLGERSSVLKEFLVGNQLNNVPAEGIRYTELFKNIVLNKYIPSSCENMCFRDSSNLDSLNLKLERGFLKRNSIFLINYWRLPVGATQTPWGLFKFLLFQWMWWLSRGIFSVLVLLPIWIIYQGVVEFFHSSQDRKL